MLETSEGRTIIVRTFAQQPYEYVWQLMKRFTQQRTEQTDDEIWVLEHEAVFTQGQAGKPEHVIDAGDIPVIHADRGGQVTYHGPGQLIMYILINLPRKKLGVRALVDIIEQSLVMLLSQYDITAVTKPDAPGVYVNGAKIASLGLRVRRGCSFHGLSLNIDMDLEPFSRINPCGYRGLQMTQMKESYVGRLDRDTIAQQLWRLLANKLGYSDIKQLDYWPDLKQ